MKSIKLILLGIATILLGILVSIGNVIGNITGIIGYTIIVCQCFKKKKG